MGAVSVVALLRLDVSVSFRYRAVDGGIETRRIDMELACGPTRRRTTGSTMRAMNGVQGSSHDGWRRALECSCRSGSRSFGLVAGGLLHWAGLGTWGNLVWIIVAACGIALSLLLDRREPPPRSTWVDVIALLALVGAVAVGEYLAGAVISVMLTSGRALEGWAAGQARRELQALLERAPKSAHRYQDGGLALVAVEQVVPGDLLLVPSGEVVPVDGSLVSSSAVFDESALTGEPLPVERSRESGCVVEWSTPVPPSTSEPRRVRLIAPTPVSSASSLRPRTHRLRWFG